MCAHAVGTVLGNAEYSDYLVFFHNVTVNTNKGLKLGKGVYLAAGSKIIGGEAVGDCVSIGVNTCIYKQEIPNNTLVYTDSNGRVTMRDNREICAAYKHFYVEDEK